MTAICLPPSAGWKVFEADYLVEGLRELPQILKKQVGRVDIGDMKVINIVEELVWECFKEVMEHRPGICRCDRCMADVCALALNKMKPRYVASDKGEVISKAAFLEKELKIELLVAVADAVEIVKANPRHEME